MWSFSILRDVQVDRPSHPAAGGYPVIVADCGSLCPNSVRFLVLLLGVDVPTVISCGIFLTLANGLENRECLRHDYFEGPEQPAMKEGETVQRHLGVVVILFPVA